MLLKPPRCDAHAFSVSITHSDAGYPSRVIRDGGLLGGLAFGDGRV